MNFFKKYHTRLAIVITCLLIGFSCSKKMTDYRSFLGDHEIVYPGVVAKPALAPGYGRVLLTWLPNSDPSVARYTVFWNNYADSITLPAISHNTSDTVKCLINNLAEYNYTFFIYSYDTAGNRSISTEIDNARVYGAIYRSNLHNRTVNTANAYQVSTDLQSVTLNFLAPDTVNITTALKYVNTGGDTVQTTLAPAVNSITLSDYKFGTSLVYQSSFIPVHGALDTVVVSHYDTFPSIFRIVPCDKGLFAEMNLPGDMGIYESDTRVSRLWDGSVGPQGFPNVYHSDGGGNLPQTLSFDMGKVYNSLNAIEETGRDCCNNPDHFEIWGIADITGAVQTLPSNDPGWKAESIAKGWTLLGDLTRSDDGKATLKFSFINNPPPVRYIRMRVLHTVTGSNYVNLSELSFWDKQ